MQPLSVLSAPPPPPPGTATVDPPVPGGIPRLSLSTGAQAPAPAPAKPGLNLKVASEIPAIKVGGKPPVKGGKPGSVLRRRSALPPVAKAGIAIVVVLIVVGAVFSYRIFFPAPSQDLRTKIAPIVTPLPKKEQPVAVTVDKPKVEAVAKPVETPTPTPAAVEVVMAPTTLTSDVKVNSTRIDAAHEASAAFRTFVASCSVGGVFQGTPSRALINGTIVREGQIVESALSITFYRIDSVQKVIYFKDSSGAVVSKNY